jgi:hypothetical protein
MRRGCQEGNRCARSKTFPGKSIHTEISPLRCASVEMTKGRAALPGRIVVGRKLVSSAGLLCSQEFPEIFTPQQNCPRSEVERSAVQRSFLEIFFDTGLAPALKESKLSAVCYMEQPLRLFHRPRVKSGNFTGALPCASEVLLSGVGDDHAAPSYTSISGGSPSCMHCNKR